MTPEGIPDDYEQLVTGEHISGLERAVSDLPKQLSEVAGKVTSEELQMRLVTDDGTEHDVSPSDVELEPAEEKGWFIARHKGKLIGGITVAAVLAGAATIAIRRHKTPK